MGKIDCGHYVPVEVEITSQTLVATSDKKVQKVVLIQNSTDKMPFDHIVVQKDASAEIVVVIFPGVSIDVPLTVDLTGENAEISLNGIYLCGGNESVNFSTNLRHLVGNGKSEQMFNGIAGGSSHAKFYGKIVIAPDAQKIEAYQTNRNILLSDEAVVDTKPQLEIYADDVKCSHGATVGKLNEDEQFYMRSRGIPEAEAKVLQMISFLSPVVDHVADEKLRQKVANEVEIAIRGLA